ncbi:MAG: thiamine phosphate synthase [Thiotrichales bacterium]|nr:thiamine phosphate synthase [Thiotrichales bacterium]
MIKQMQHQTTERPIIWSIAGSDCSGGAGIQADIKTGHALGCEVCTIITANTVQNSQTLIAIHPVEVSLLQEQFDCLLADKPPKVIKIGLIANNAQLQWLIERLTFLKQHPNHADLKIVLDPIMKASIGKDLVAEEIEQPLLDRLINLTEVITPNISEAARLAQDPKQQLTLETWAERIADKGCKTVVVTGGHSEHPESVIDHCFCGDLTFKLSSPRIETSYGHGSGCTFSTAYASFLAHGYLDRDAFIQSKAFINKAFQLSADHSDYYGALIQPSWPVDKNCYPQVVSNDGLAMQSGLTFPSLGTTQLGLYPVIDSIEWLTQLLPMGLEVIQLRLKNRTQAELAPLIQQAVELAKAYPRTRLFINDHWQLAIQFGAYGVHLGQEDIQAADLKAIHQSGLRLGISTHGSYEFILAEQAQPSYLAVGAVFETQTKDMTGQIQGVNNLQKLVNLNGIIPLVAIGGITLENATPVIKTGVNSIAVVTAITKANNPEKVVQTFQRLFSKLVNTRD